MVSCEDFDVIQYENDGTWDIFIRMELLIPLTEWVKGKKVQEKDVIRIGKDLSELLAICKKKNFLHGDIKPCNIFIDQANHFKLGDFGLARVVSDANSEHSKGVGTEAFMAPEIFYGNHYDHRADIYSLGLIMYWLLNDQILPFISDSISYSKAIKMRLAGELLPKLTETSRDLDRIVRKACDPKPEKRWQSANELLSALKKLKPRNLQGEGEKNNSRVKKWTIRIIAVFAIILTAISILFLGKRPPPPPPPSPTPIPTTLIPTHEPTPIPTTPIPTQEPTPEPMPRPTPTPTQTKVLTGYVLELGCCEQDIIEVNGSEPIIWRVLNTKADSRLVVNTPNN